MKKNFLITSGLIDTWEFYENNFILGKWCEFYKFKFFDKEKLKNKIPKKINIIKDRYHWDDHVKKGKDYEYLKKKIEYLLEIISEKLSTIHNVNENKEYWRVIVYNWLIQYTAIIFDRWENIRIFFEKNNTEKFYSNFILLNNLDYIPKDHVNFKAITQNDEWNHLIFLRLFHFLNIQNLSLVEKRIKINNLKKESRPEVRNLPPTLLAIKLIDNIISKFAFKFNKIIFESFLFPRMEYLKICLRFKLIPSKYSNFFNFQIKKDSLSKDNSDKRIRLKNLLSKIDNQDKFIQFLLLNIHKDMPRSYLENFDVIKKKILPFAKKKKIIFSMYSLYANDNFKIYIAETKKVGSKYIHTKHGGGFTFKMDPFFGFFEKAADKVITWDNTEQIRWGDAEQNQDIYVNLSPTLPIIKLKNSKIGSNCSIIFRSNPKYQYSYHVAHDFDQEIDVFNELTQFVNKLNPEIKSKVKFRDKNIGYYQGYNFSKKFSEMFGEKTIDKDSFKNPFKKTILNSKLIIVTYPETAFSEAMFSNIPTILIIKKNHWPFSKTALHTFNDLKKNKIAFEDFNEAKIYINKHWKELNLWWECENVQFARKKFLENFFNVKSDWYREWSDYIYFSLSSSSKSN